MADYSISPGETQVSVTDTSGSSLTGGGSYIQKSPPLNDTQTINTTSLSTCVSNSFLINEQTFLVNEYCILIDEL